MPIPNVTEFTGQLPDDQDPATFPARAQALFDWLAPVMTPELNAAITAVNAALNTDATVLDALATLQARKWTDVLTQFTAGIDNGSIASGIYWVDATATGTKPPNLSSFVLIVLREDLTGMATQIAIVDDQFWQRRRTGSWSQWRSVGAITPPFDGFNNVSADFYDYDLVTVGPGCTKVETWVERLTTANGGAFRSQPVIRAWSNANGSTEVLSYQAATSRISGAGAVSSIVATNWVPLGLTMAADGAEQLNFKLSVQKVNDYGNNWLMQVQGMSFFPNANDAATFQSFGYFILPNGADLKKIAIKANGSDPFRYNVTGAVRSRVWYD